MFRSVLRQRRGQLELLLCLILCSTLFSKDISKQNKPITVKVLLAKLVDEAHLEVRGRYLIYNPKTDELIGTGSKKKKGKVTSSDSGIIWKDLLRGTHEIRIVPNDPKSAIFVNGNQYKGCVEIYSIGGTINVVNEIDAENYLKTILSTKISERMSKEALDAIIITERTNLYFHLQKSSFASWQVEAEKVGYLGYGTKQNSAIQESVERTRDIILNYEKQPFATNWSMNHAGLSVAHAAVFRKNTKTPPGVNHLPSFHRREKTKWKTSIPIKVLATLVDLPSITEIDLFRAEKTDKIYGLRFKNANAKKDFDFFTVQTTLGQNLLQSNDFTVTLKGKKAYFTGYGKGVGVGLCALSADIMAKRKTSVEKILTTHFPNTQLINVREESGEAPITSFIWK